MNLQFQNIKTEYSFMIFDTMNSIQYDSFVK